MGMVVSEDGIQGAGGQGGGISLIAYPLGLLERILSYACVTLKKVIGSPGDFYKKKNVRNSEGKNEMSETDSLWEEMGSCGHTTGRTRNHSSLMQLCLHH